MGTTEKNEQHYRKGPSSTLKGRNAHNIGQTDTEAGRTCRQIHCEKRLGRPRKKSAVASRRSMIEGEEKHRGNRN